MNKSNKTLTFSTFFFVLVSFFIVPMNAVNADVTISGIVKIQACGDYLATEEKKGKDEEEPDCE